MGIDVEFEGGVKRDVFATGDSECFEDLGVFEGDVILRVLVGEAWLEGELLVDGFEAGAEELAGGVVGDVPVAQELLGGAADGAGVAVVVAHEGFGGGDGAGRIIVGVELA